MKVRLPSPLQNYTGGRAEIEADGQSLDELLWDLDRRYPGIRFRMIDEQGSVRPHIRLFVNATLQRSLQVPLNKYDEVIIVAALSGG